MSARTARTTTWMRTSKEMATANQISTISSPLMTLLDAAFRCLAFKGPNLKARLRAVILMIFAPAALTEPDVRELRYQFDGADELHHDEAQLRLHPQPERRSMRDRQRVAVHLVGEQGLRMPGQLHADRAVIISRPTRIRLGA